MPIHPVNPFDYHYVHIGQFNFMFYNLINCMSRNLGTIFLHPSQKLTQYHFIISSNISMTKLEFYRISYFFYGFLSICKLDITHTIYIKLFTLDLHRVFLSDLLELHCIQEDSNLYIISVFPVLLL